MKGFSKTFLKKISKTKCYVCDKDVPRGGIKQLPIVPWDDTEWVPVCEEHKADYKGVWAKTGGGA